MGSVYRSYVLVIHVNGNSGYNYNYAYNYINLNLEGYMSVHTHVHVYILLNWCNLDDLIYNIITSIVNVIRLKLFTLISIVNKQDR